jgi:hypothetical protein
MLNEQDDQTSREFLTFFESSDVMYGTGDPLSAACESLYATPHVHPHHQIITNNGRESADFNETKYFHHPQEQQVSSSVSNYSGSSPSSEEATRQSLSAENLSVQQYLSGQQQRHGHQDEGNQQVDGFGATIFDPEDVVVHGTASFANTIAQNHLHAHFDKMFDPPLSLMGSFHHQNQQVITFNAGHDDGDREDDEEVGAAMRRAAGDHQGALQPFSVLAKGGSSSAFDHGHQHCAFGDHRGPCPPFVGDLDETLDMRMIPADNQDGMRTGQGHFQQTSVGFTGMIINKLVTNSN